MATRCLQQGVCGLLLILMAAGSAYAQEVKVKSVYGKNLWEDFPNNIGKPISRWDGDVLVVQIVETINGDELLDEKAVAAAIEGTHLRLTYRMRWKRQSPVQPGEPAPPGVVVAVMLEFRVQGIPKRAFNIEISRTFPNESSMPSPDR